MPAQITTRAQVNGYRFLIRRLEHALIRADSRMIHDPMRGQLRALLIGAVVTTLICAAAGVMAFFRPAPNFGSSAIMVSKASGTMYVRIGDRLHPVLNLASARLIVGKSDPPQQVDDKFLNTVALGPMVGIVGGPGSISGPEDLNVSSWAVCDSGQALTAEQPTAQLPTMETTVVAGTPVLGPAIRAAAPDETVLARANGTTYLVYKGIRAVVNPADPTLRSALRLDAGEIRDVSVGLLNSFPLAAPIAPIDIPGLGEPSGLLPPTYRVGSILKAVDSRGEQLYVLLREGLQPISSVTADIMRYGNPLSPSAAQPTDISPALLSRAPVVHVLPVDQYPTAPPRFVRADSDTVMCMAWQHNTASDTTATRLLVGNRLPVPAEAQPVRLATADGAGPGLDGVYLKPGTGAFVQAAGDGRDGRARGQLFYVDDLGVRFNIKDEPTASALGVVGDKQAGKTTVAPQPAPWPVLSLLPPGPELSQQAALIVHDGIAADPAGLKITLPKS
jgi:type VII secretion protein EccB